jgi:NitT/TauT family transport system substrate-binding protein
MRTLATLIAFTGILIAACGGSTTAPASSAPASVAASATATPLTPIKVKVAYTNITGDSMPTWVAMDAGIFKKNGLDVELITVDGGARGMQAVLAGEIDIATLGGAECLSATAAGAKITMTAVGTPVFPYQLMAAADIKTAADLKGKKIGISSPGGSADIATRKALKDIGLDPDKDVTLVALGSHAQRTAALFAGSIQAAVDDPPNTTELVDKGFHNVYDLAAKRLGTAQTGVVAQQTFIAAKPEAMQRFIDSQIEAVAYMKKNKAQTVAIMKKYYNAPNGKGFEEAVDFYVGEVFPALPYPRPELFVDAQAVLGASNAKVKTIDVKTILDDSFVKSAADRGVDKR